MNDNMRDYVVTLGVATGVDAEGRKVTGACAAPILLRAYSTSHVYEKIQMCMPGAVILRCEERRENRKRVLGLPRKRQRSKPNTMPTAVPVLRVANMEDVAGV